MILWNKIRLETGGMTAVSGNKKTDIQENLYVCLTKPKAGLEPATYALRMRRSAN